MSWPQNPDDSRRNPPQPPQQPAPPPGFGPPPAWDGGPQGGTPQYPPPGPYGQWPGAQPPVPQPPYGSPPPPPAGPRRGRTVLAVAGGVAALALIGTGIAYGLHGGGNGPAAAGPPPSRPASAASAPSDGEPGVSRQDDVKPVFPGWQTQTRESHGFRYDVPPAAEHWKVFDPDIVDAYTDSHGKPLVAMSGTADYREGGCASAVTQGIGTAGKGQLAQIGTQGGAGDLPTNAVNAAGNWGFAAYGGPEHKPRIRMGTPVPWKRNGIDGYTVTARITVTYRPSSCVPPTAIVRSIAQRLKDGSVHEWVIYADQGVPNALTESEIEKIMETVRPSSG